MGIDWTAGAYASTASRCLAVTSGDTPQTEHKNGTNTGHEWQAMTQHKDPLMCPVGYLADLVPLSNDHLFSEIVTFVA